MSRNNYQQAVKWLLDSEYAVLFTGAGVSVESGIPTFRGKDGLWEKYNPVFLNTVYFRDHPRKSWKLIKEIFYDFFGKAKPNAAHEIIAKWEKQGIVKSIITQNIDNLHQEAGSKNVIEFHGTSRTLTCMNCKENYQSTPFIQNLPPHCPKCDGILKPDFVFFNEPIPTKTYENTKEAARHADLFMLVGTTGEIMPASMVPFIAQDNNAKFIEINIKPSKYTKSITNVFLKGKATRIFTELDNLIT
ncbi:MAG: NAD-dependent protein deacylase [Promethearchaeia archaeon]